MRHLCSLFALVFLTIPASAQELRDFIPPSNFDRGTALARAPGALLWNFQLFYIGPRNARLFEEAVKKAKESLKPGETVHYRVIVRYAGSTVIFQRIERDDIPTISVPEDKVLAVIELTKMKFGFRSRPLFPLSKEAFAEVKKQLGDSPLTYEDHCFVTDAINALNEHEPIDVRTYEDGQKLSPRLERQDLTKEDLTAWAVGQGVVILVAKADESTYRVYDTETDKIDGMAYTKGEFLKSLGNTVWLWSRSRDGAEYVTIYSNLDTIKAKLGQYTIPARIDIGQWKRSTSRALNWSIWRVHGPEQRFLREIGEPKPYCVVPIPEKSK